jgi:hypothetical protein
MTTTTVFGVVPANIPSLGYKGKGFTVSLHGDGEYAIAFDPMFADVPAVIVTQGGNYIHPDTTDGTVIGTLTSSQCTVLTGNHDGGRQNRQFSFIAMGPM